jgi:hypothetical protein
MSQVGRPSRIESDSKECFHLVREFSRSSPMYGTYNMHAYNRACIGMLRQSTIHHVLLSLSVRERERLEENRCRLHHRFFLPLPVFAQLMGARHDSTRPLVANSDGMSM